MRNLDEIRQGLLQLSGGELAELRAWLDDVLWDRQVAADSAAGVLDRLAAEALFEHRAGKTREI